MLVVAVEMNLSKHVTKIDLNSSTDKFAIFVGEEQLDESEAVFVTIPVPQILGQLKGSIAQLIDTDKILLRTVHETTVSFVKDDDKEIRDKLAQVRYYSRFAVGLFYPPSITNLNIPWRIYSVDDEEHDFLRFLVVDNAKRNRSSLLGYSST